MTVISIATIARVREHCIPVLVVADPIAAALGLHDVSGLAAKSAFCL